MPADATPFDTAGFPFSHGGGAITFEVLARHHAIEDPAVQRLGEIIHQADVEDDLYDAPEAAGLDAVVRGLGALLGDDRRRLAETAVIYDGLLHALGSDVRVGGRVVGQLAGDHAGCRRLGYYTSPTRYQTAHSVAFWAR